MPLDKLRNKVRPAHRWVAAQLPPNLRRRYLHDVGTQSIGNFRNPKTFNEKVNWRILHDRRPMVADACDKLRMKEIARDRVSEADLRIPETYWAGTDIGSIPDEVLARDWVAKPNHSSGQVLFGPKTRAGIADASKEWLQDRQSDQLAEWGYSQARRLILFEERLPCQGPPNDYKFFVFDGRPTLIQANRGRFVDHVEAFYTPQWTVADVSDPRVKFAETSKPPVLDEMLEIVAKLGQGWDFIRVDLYCLEDEVWFGELSPYPGGGVTLWRPKSFNLEFGMQWRLPSPDEVGARS